MEKYKIVIEEANTHAEIYHDETRCLTEARKRLRQHYPETELMMSAGVDHYEGQTGKIFTFKFHKS